MPTVNTYLRATRNFAVEHKIISGLVVLTILTGVYKSAKATNSTAETRYVLGTVERGTLVSSVSGSGTVSASREVDLKAKASGDIVSLNVKTGDRVNLGATIASLDSSSANSALRSAEIALEKLQAPADAASVISARQALVDAQSAEANAHTAALREITSTMLDMPTVMDGMQSLLYTNDGYLNDSAVSSLGMQAAEYRLKAGSEYDKAKREYELLSASFQSVTAHSSDDDQASLLADMIVFQTDLSNALKDAQVAVTYVKSLEANVRDSESHDLLTQGTTAQSNLSAWISIVSGHLSSLVTSKNTLESAPNTVSQRQASLDKLLAGADPLDIESQELSLQQRRDDYRNYFVTAPFAGVIGKVSVKKGDSVSSGTAIATLITTDKIANVSLNEVDAAKVKVGDKATLTFDAIDGLTITGTVTNFDLIGTVSQGVVTYNAEITFDTDDPRVLPGMTTSADIITDAHTDTLIVPTSAVKTDAQGSYVLVFTPKLASSGTGQGVVSSLPPTEVAVTVGLSNDTSVEILSGLEEGQQIVTRVVTPTIGTTAQAAPSLLGGSRTAVGGQNVRFAR
jgi:HlyD family secretion protein